MLGLSLATNMAVVSTHKLSGYIFVKYLIRQLDGLIRGHQQLLDFFFLLFVRVFQLLIAVRL